MCVCVCVCVCEGQRERKRVVFTRDFEGGWVQYMEYRR